MLDVDRRYAFVGHLDSERPHVVLAHDLKSPDPDNKYRVMKMVHQTGLKKFGPEVINESMAMKLMSGKEGFLTFYELYHQHVDNSYWIVMECAEGGSVLDYLEDFPLLLRSQSEPIHDVKTDGPQYTEMSHSARKNRLKGAIGPRLRKIFKKKEKEVDANADETAEDEEAVIDYKTSDETTLPITASFVGTCRVFDKCIPQIVVFTIFAKMVRCVQRLHEENLAHMDIKLCNFFMRKDPNDICLGDFGYVSLHKQGFVQEAAKGTLMYAAPEILSGPYDPQKADVWSLGICLYVMIKNTIPFHGETVPEVRYAIEKKEPPLENSPVDHLLRKMLTKDPNKRPVINEVLSHAWMQQTPMKRLPVGQLSVIQEIIKDYEV